MLIWPRKCCICYEAGSSGQVTSPLATVLLVPFWNREGVKKYWGLREWLFIVVDIYCCCKTENDLMAFSCVVVQHAAHEVTHCEFGSTCVWRTLWSEAEGCPWLATSHGFGWQLPLMCSIPSQCGREVPVWSSKRTVGLRKICSSQACLNRWALAGLGEGRGALPLPCQQCLWGVMAPMSYILLFCRQQFWSDVNIDLDIKDQILWPWDLYQLFPSQPH